jgi:hypothetical protein
MNINDFSNTVSPLISIPLISMCLSSLINGSRKKFKSDGFPLFPQNIETGNGLLSFAFLTLQRIGQKTDGVLLHRESPSILICNSAPAEPRSKDFI